MKNKNCDLIYKDECYKIIGCCYEVYNSLGFGLREKAYQKALEAVLSENKIEYQSQLHTSIKLGEKIIGKYFLDLFIENKIVVELKVGDHFLTKDIEQLFSYLKLKDLKLGLLVNFTSNGVKYKRIVNLV